MVRTRSESASNKEEWIDDRWHLQKLEDWRSYVIFEADYGMLRDGSVLEIELSTGPVIRTSYDLTSLFNTPVQPNIDNCGEEPWPQQRTYVPLVNAQDVHSSTVSYRTDSIREGGLWTQVEVRAQGSESPDGALTLLMSCQGTNGSQRLSMRGLSGIEGFETAVSLAIDDGASQVLNWRVSTWEETGQRPIWIEGGREIALLRGASTVTVEVLAAGLGPVTFDLDGFFDTPVQGNIDECGYYKPGETRDPPIELNTQGKHAGHQRRRHCRSVAAVADQRSASKHLPDGESLERWMAGNQFSPYLWADWDSAVRLGLADRRADRRTGFHSMVARRDGPASRDLGGHLAWQ